MTYLSNKSRVPGEESKPPSQALSFFFPLTFELPGLSFLSRSSPIDWEFFISEIKHKVKFLRILRVKSNKRINKKESGY